MQQKRTLPTQKDYRWTQWTPAQIKKLPKEILAEKTKIYEAIKALPKKERTFKNVLGTIEVSDRPIQETMQALHLLSSTSPKRAVREAADAVNIALESALLDLEHDEEIFEAVKDAKKNTKKTELEDDEKKLLDDTLRAYQRVGFHLPEQDQKKLKKLRKELSQLGTDFAKNLSEYSDFILLGEKDTAGLSQNYLQGLKKKDGKYLVTLEYPDYFPFMRTSENAKKRAELLRKFLKRGGAKNLTILRKLVSKRTEVATLLGYKNWADYKTEVKMVKTGEKALNFVEDLLSKVEEKASSELKELEALKKEDMGKNETLKLEDVAFYSERHKKAKYDLDTEAIREYFPTEYVRSGIFEVYSKLFGITIEPVSGHKLWHKDVQMYAIKTKKGAPVAHFFLDLFPRAGKYGHAAAFPIHQGYEAGTGKERHYRAPSACLVTNFPKSTKKNPSLLSHGEVVTFFHEFGHLMHHTLTTSRLASQSGFSTAWDFVEAPSQMLENWTWEETILKKYLSSHYQTGEPLPQKIIQNLIASKNEGVGYATARQLSLALFDLKIHTESIDDINKAYAAITEKHLGLDQPTGAKFPASFAHLAGGYDAGYYGYMYSKVFASDMYTRFKKEGPLNTKTGREYKQNILERGGSAEPKKLVKDFLGRNPNNKAFLHEIGAK